MRQFRIFLSVLPALLLSLASTTAYAHLVEAVNAQWEEFNQMSPLVKVFVKILPFFLLYY